jgi:hypothetical protein
MKTWLIVWTLAGLIVPLLCLLRYRAFGGGLPYLAVYLWPSSVYTLPWERRCGDFCVWCNASVTLRPARERR